MALTSVTRKSLSAGTVAVLAFFLAAGGSAEAQEPLEADSRAAAGTADRIAERDRLDTEARSFQSEGKLNEAVAAAEKMLAIEREVLGDDSDDADGSRQMILEIHLARDDLEAARRVARERLTECERARGEDHWRTRDARLRVADVEARAGLSNALRQRAAEGDRLLREARTANSEGRYADALGRAGRAAEAYKETLGAGHRDYGIALLWVGINNWRLADYENANEALGQAETVLRQAVGEEHPDWASLLNAEAQVAQNRGDYASAERLYRSTVELTRRLKGEKSYDYAIFLNNLGELLSDLGRYDEAEPVHRHLADFWKELNGENDENYGYSLQRLAEVHQSRGEYGKAEPLLRQAVEVQRLAYGDEHPRYATALASMGSLYLDMGDLDRADAAYRESAEIRRKAVGEKHPDYANAVASLARLAEERGDYVRAESLRARAEAILKETLGEDHPDYAVALASRAGVLGQLRRYDEVEPLYRRSLEIIGKSYGEESPLYATLLSNLAYFVSNGPDPDRAVAIYRQALEITGKALDESHPDYRTRLESLCTTLGEVAERAVRRGDLGAAQSAADEAVAISARLWPEADWRVADNRRAADYVKLLGTLDAEGRADLAEADRLYDEEIELSRAARYREALSVTERAAASYTARLGEHHWKTADALHALGYLHKELGDRDEAERLYRRALEARREALGPEHPDVSQTLHNMAVMFEERGDFAEALSIHRDNLETLRRIEADPRSIISTLQSLAVVSDMLGDPAEAQSYYQEAMKVGEALGQNHPQLADCLLAFGFFYHELGDSARAEPLIRHAVEIYRNTGGERHPDYARGLDFLASALSDTKPDEAEQLYNEALAIRRERLGNSDLDTAVSLHNLAVHYAEQRKFKLAEPLYREAVAIEEAGVGSDSPRLLRTLENFAELYDRMGRFGDAAALHERVITLARRTYGESHPDVLSAIHRLALHHARAGDSAEALRLTKETLSAGADLFAGVAAGLSERQQLAYRSQVRARFNLYLTLTSQDPGSAADAYTEVLTWEAPVSAAQGAVARLRRSEAEGGSETGRLFVELEDATRRLAARSRATPDADAPVPLAQELSELTDKVEDLQRRLAATSRAYREAQQEQRVTGEQIIATLPDRSVLVDFVEYARFSPGDPDEWPMHLAAFTLSRGQPVERIELGPIRAVASAIEEWRSSYGRATPSDDPGAVLRRLLLDPIADRIGDADLLLIAPTATVSRVPFAALPGEKPNTYLLEERAVAVVPLPQHLPELLQNRNIQPQDPSLLVVGDVDFDAAPGEVSPQGPAGGSVLVASVPPGERGEAGGRWRPLPGSASEIKAVADEFRQQGMPVVQLSRATATASAVRRELGRHTHLHFATHGYFAPTAVRSAFEAVSRGGGANLFGRQDVSGFHPGLLSGLVLAGANQPPAAGADDGILTALEVQSLDLSGADLVTLSACETGLGESVAAGEGLLGLQRAFQIAGARTTVSALWKVPDRSTQALMDRFYRNLWEQGMSKSEALRQAQLWLLRDGKREAEALRGLDLEPDAQEAETQLLPPRYWAAFVIAGDWR